LLAALPQLTVLVTSRSSLHLADEHTFAVPTLPLPSFIASRFSAARLMQYAGVRLFVERARAAQPNFTITPDHAAAIVGICARLDGLPLALELAAARVRLLSADEILARLDHSLTLLTGGALELPIHQRTLRATLDWSYSLLSPLEQRLFTQLAIFMGGFTAKAAEAVCQLHEMQPSAVLDGLAALIDQSLIQTSDSAGLEPHLTMLQIIHEYALEHLQSSGAETLMRQRHAEFYVAWAAQATAQLFGAQSHVWLERIELEHDNLRAALRWLLDHQQAEQAGRIGGALMRFWDARGYVGEGRQWLNLILHDAAKLSEAVRAQALYAAGWLALRQGDYATATPSFEESLRLFRSLEEPVGMAAALHGLGGVALELVDYARAQNYFAESLALRRAVNDVWAISNSLLNLGKIARNQGDHARAVILLEESLALGRQVGERSSIAFALRSLGRTLSLQGHWQRAAALHRESLSLSKELKHQLGIVEALDGIAEVATALEQWSRAARLYGAAKAIRHAIGAPIPPVSRPIYEAYWNKVRAALDAKTFRAEWDAGRTMTLEQAVSYALE
jgi:predicted ATPase